MQQNVARVLGISFGEAEALRGVCLAFDEHGLTKDLPGLRRLT